MEFAVWTFKHAAQEPLERAAKPALQGLLMLLENGMSSPTVLQSTSGTLGAIMQSASELRRMYWSHHCMPDDAAPDEIGCCADTSSGSDITSTAVRGFTYQAIGQLASRVPALFTADVAIARRFFRSLSTEPAGVRTALQEAISTLASAYQGCKGMSGCLLQGSESHIMVQRLFVEVHASCYSRLAGLMVCRWT